MPDSKIMGSFNQISNKFQSTFFLVNMTENSHNNNFILILYGDFKCIKNLRIYPTRSQGVWQLMMKYFKKDGLPIINKFGVGNEI